MIRRPMVAGMFYAGQARVLSADIESLAPAEKVKRINALGAVIPHAGYMYSGKTAAKVYAHLQPADTYILLGPNHTGRGWSLSFSGASAWETPLGRVEVDEGLVQQMLEWNSDLRRDESAHAQEHSLEVQLPFIQKIRPDATIVPLIMGTHDLSHLRAVGATLARTIQSSRQKCLIIASSDMNHFANLQRTKQLDHLALERVVRLDPEGLLRVVQQENISMCGAGPVAAMLFAARELGAHKAEVVEYSTSADASGDEERVVGYAGIVVS